jgi:hypothetical protein
MVKISPRYSDTDFSWPLTLDDKITLFLDRVYGWQLDIADKCINGEKGLNGTVVRQQLIDSGFAALLIVLSYFEMIAKYIEGYQATGRSRYYFRTGVYHVFPQLGTAPQVIVDDLLGTLYEGARCGLYHSALTTSRIVLTGATTTSMAFNAATSMLIINPHLLVPALKRQLKNYEYQIKDITNTQLRQKFERRFDFDTSQ